MIVIFDIRGGLNDMFKDIIAIIQFISSSNINYTVRSATFRQLNNPTIFKIYELKNIISEDIFLNDKNYVTFNSIRNDVTNNNTYNFYNLKIEKKLWNDTYKTELTKISSQLLNLIISCNKKYFIIGGSFWSYYHEFVFNIDIINSIKPSNKILESFNRVMNRIGKVKYNFIHYRYEDDWNTTLKKWDNLLVNTKTYKNV